MTRSTRMVLTTLFGLGMATGTSVAASAQQWGPSAQSHVYHDPTNPQTMTAYNTTVIAPRQQYVPQQAAPVVNRTPTRVAAATPQRRRTTAALRRTTYTQSGY